MCFYIGVSSGDSSQISRFIGDSSSHSASLESDDVISWCTVTPGGHRHYVPTCVDDSSKPVVNQVFDSLEKGMTFYMEYGQLCGFDTRRSTENKDDDNIIILTKYVVCGRAGFKEKKNQGLSYRISAFVEDHNRELASGEGRQFLRVNRQMSFASRKFVFDSSKVNIGSSQSFSMMKELYGGYANVSATVRDFRNLSRDLRAYVDERDTQMIIDKFKVKHESCESFYRAHDVDAEGHLTKLFWADSIARMNHELYGDAI
ncbi:hypothetical protein POM88_044152 [Heracleum sosnowskyi]|uniref:Protein FAR1-RELATED SEQUENCE n=1 Tax=Heracleum sosnowskyi TaxID=360622 RepID=A0AAD8H3S4_9APIA|nr:hypothetical protein POM88_044152 [Heracleum sosnowskyi]